MEENSINGDDLTDDRCHEASVDRWNPLEVRWGERYGEIVDRFWCRLPPLLKPCLLTVSVFVLGITIRGDWVIAVVHLMKHLKMNNNYPTENEVEGPTNTVLTDRILKEFFYIFIGCNCVAYSMYFFIGGFLHWYYYVNRRDHPESWKCQPQRWLSPELERDEIYNGCISLLITNLFTAALACYIGNGGWSLIYHRFDDYPVVWWFLQWPVLFFFQDYLVYLVHRTFHTPFLYKRYHKLHHRYKQPTAFSVTAIHPVDIVSTQMVMCLPMFIMPLHWISFCGVAFYTYYYAIFDHSGIDFKAPWWQPWRPDTMFHDNHHQYFHVNFSFNCYYWDKLHGTYRRPDRIYNENIFYGSGKALADATKNEIDKEERERESENPNAHRNKKNYLLPNKIR